MKPLHFVGFALMLLGVLSLGASLLYQFHIGFDQPQHTQWIVIVLLLSGSWIVKWAGPRKGKYDEDSEL
jgi:hypothetical protein